MLSTVHTIEFSEELGLGRWWEILFDRYLSCCTSLRSLRPILNAYHSFTGSRERGQLAIILQNASSSGLKPSVYWPLVRPFNEKDCLLLPQHSFTCFDASLRKSVLKRHDTSPSSSYVGWAIATSDLRAFSSCNTLLLPFMRDDTSWFILLNGPVVAKGGTGNYCSLNDMKISSVTSCRCESQDDEGLTSEAPKVGSWH